MPETHQTVGIIGGYGPETTAEFYLQLVFGCKDAGATNRPHIIISSPDNPIQYEYDFIGENRGTERFVPILTAAAQELEHAGADFIVLPCNSLHKFIEEVRTAVTVPVLSILEETAAYVDQQGFQRVGLISTAATIENRLYEQEFERRGIDFVMPDARLRGRINAVIKRLVDGEYSDADKETVTQVMQALASEQQAEALVLACTDLQLLVSDDQKLPICDTMKILANATVNTILGERKLS